MANLRVEFRTVAESHFTGEVDGSLDFPDGTLLGRGSLRRFLSSCCVVWEEGKPKIVGLPR
jgi:hypothetical protein